MPTSRNPDYIDWRKNDEKKVLIANLEDGILSAAETTVSSEQAWLGHVQKLTQVQRCQI
jgi:hypothetical protein